MDQELKDHLEKMEARLRRDGEAMEGRLREHFREQLDGVETKLRQHVETVETRLLPEFWKWARTADARYRQSQGMVGVIDERLQNVEDRISALEQKSRLN